MNIKNITSVMMDKVDRVNQHKGGDKNVEKNVSGEDKFRELSKDEIIDAVDRMNNTTKALNERVSFSYHEKTNRIIVKVIDSNTNEVVREIPPKDIIKLLEHLQEFIGMFVDESR